MPNITVLHAGDTKEDFLLKAEREYIKRLKSFCTYKTVLIKEERLPDNEDNAVLVGKALKNEAERIRQFLPKRCFSIALCVEGKRLSSEGFSGLIEDKLREFSDIVFIIGSSHGLDEGLKKNAIFYFRCRT